MLNIQELVEAVARNLKAYAGVSREHKVEEFVAVLANKWFSMMASDIMPFDTIIVEVIQDW